MDDIRNMTTEQLEQLLAQRREADRQAAEDKRKAYEATKAEFLSTMESRTRETVAAVREFYDFVVSETSAFHELMRDYGALRSMAQRGYAIQNERFKIEVRSNKVKGFDERADIAAGRLIEVSELGYRAVTTVPTTRCTNSQWPCWRGIVTVTSTTRVYRNSMSSNDALMIRNIPK